MRMWSEEGRCEYNGHNSGHDGREAMRRGVLAVWRPAALRRMPLHAPPSRQTVPIDVIVMPASLTVD